MADQNEIPQIGRPIGESKDLPAAIKAMLAAFPVFETLDARAQIFGYVPINPQVENSVPLFGRIPKGLLGGTSGNLGNGSVSYINLAASLITTNLATDAEKLDKLVTPKSVVDYIAGLGLNNSGGGVLDIVSTEAAFAQKIQQAVAAKEAAIAAGTEANLKEIIITGKFHLTEDRTIPDNLVVHRANHGQILLRDPEMPEQTPKKLTIDGIGFSREILSGHHPFILFARPGDVIFTGANDFYPRRICAQMFEAIDAATSFQIANDAFRNKNTERLGLSVTIELRAGKLDNPMFLSENHHLELGSGHFRSDYMWVSPIDNFNLHYPERPVLVVDDNTSIVGQGSNTVVHGSTNPEMSPMVLQATSQAHANWGLQGIVKATNKNIRISNIFFQGENRPVWSEAPVAVSLGNCKNGHIDHCWFDNWQSHSAYIGGSQNDAFVKSHGYASSITDCFFTRSGYSSFGVITARNMVIANNHDSDFGAVRYDGTEG
ncbi:MAG TPA: hypothetical protein VF679_09015, partial [Pedobacter sp.]